MSDMQQSSSEEERSFNPLNIWLKAIGTLGDGATAQGRLVKRIEDWLSGNAMKLAGNERFLSQMGGLMERGFMLRAQATRNMEEALHSMGMPTINDLHEVNDTVQNVDDKVEAMGFQLEAMMMKLESMEAALKEAKAPAPKKRAAPRRRSTKAKDEAK